MACAGWSVGPVQGLGALTAASLAVTALLSCCPVRLRPAALAAVPLALGARPYALPG